MNNKGFNVKQTLVDLIRLFLLLCICLFFYGFFISLIQFIFFLFQENRYLDFGLLIAMLVAYRLIAFIILLIKARRSKH